MARGAGASGWGGGSGSGGAKGRRAEYSSKTSGEFKFTAGQKRAISQIGERAKKTWDIVGDVSFKKGKGDIVYMTYKRREHFGREKGTIERISDVTKSLVVSPDGKTRRIFDSKSKSTDTFIPNKKRRGR